MAGLRLLRSKPLPLLHRFVFYNRRVDGRRTVRSSGAIPVQADAERAVAELGEGTQVQERSMHIYLYANTHAPAGLGCPAASDPFMAVTLLPFSALSITGHYGTWRRSGLRVK